MMGGCLVAKLGRRKCEWRTLYKEVKLSQTPRRGGKWSAFRLTCDNIMTGIGAYPGAIFHLSKPI